MTEIVKDMKDIIKLEDNRVVGEVQLTDTTITFEGSNNLLYCEEGVKLHNSLINFQGDNSIVYLSSSKHDYVTHISVFNDSTVFFGKDNNIEATLKVNAQEAQNIFIGDDCIFGADVTIRTSDAFPVFSGQTSHRVNHPASVFIGDHVWLDQFSTVSRGVRIGSGSIIYNGSLLLPNSVVKSNSYLAGNPAKLIAEGVFFTDSYTAHFNEEKTEESSNFNSDVFLYEVKKKETLSLDYLDKVLGEFTIDEKLEFIQKLLVLKKRKNRFAIE